MLIHYKSMLYKIIYTALLGTMLSITTTLFADPLETATTLGNDSNALISGDILANQVPVTEDNPTLSSSDSIDIKIDILPDFKQLIPNLNALIPNLDEIMPGLNGEIPNLNEMIGDIAVPVYIVVSYNSTFYVKNEKGEWVPWQPGDPLPIAENVDLSGGTENIDVTTGLKGLSGTFEVYVGYGLPNGEEIVYNLEPLTFSVEPDASAENS